jgi:hypothetical protein
VAILSPTQVYSLARSRGFSPQDSVTIVGIAATESGGDTASVQAGGQGRGLIQIDLGQHPDVTEAQALDPVWSLDWLRRQGGPGKVTFYGPRDRPSVAAAARTDALRANPEAKAGGKSLWETIAGGLPNLAAGIATGGAVTDVGGAVSAVRTTADVLDAIGRAAAWMANPRNWLRVIEVLIGVALVLAGLWHLSPGTAAAVKGAARKGATALAVA